MRRSMMKTAAVVISGVMVTGLLAGCGEAKLDGMKTVATVDDTDIPMGVLSLAVRSQQANLEYMYSYYVQAGYVSSIWDQTVDEDSEETYGQQTVTSILDEVELMYLLKSHASDYGVELTEDDEKAIADAAAKFVADNTEETMKELSVTEDQVKEYLELLTYRERMHESIEAEVDTEVSDEEAQQSGFTYVNIPLDEEEDEDTVDDEEAEASEDETGDTDEDAAEDDSAEDAEEAGTDAEVTSDEDSDTAEEATIDAQTKALELLKAMQEDPDADMAEVAKTIDDTLTSYTGTFAANPAEDEESDEEEDTSYSAYPDELIEALRGLKDGELVDQVITTDSGYYVARLDQVFDEDATESEKESIVSERQEEHYTEVTDGWKEEAKITVDEKVLAALKVTDSHTFTLKVEETADEDIVEDPDMAEAEASEAAEVTEEETEDTADSESTAEESEDIVEETDAETADTETETEE